MASVTISTVFSDNGIIKKAQEAANKTKEAVQKEKDELNQLYNDLASALNNVPEEPTPPEPTLPSDGSYSKEKGVNTPKLGSGMTPIKWNGSNWVEYNMEVTQSGMITQQRNGQMQKQVMEVCGYGYQGMHIV